MERPEILPHWTVPSFQATGGRFPLGLEAVSLNVLANVLAPGLPVLSRHPRYWSIYTYLVKRFQDTRAYTSKTSNTALGRYLKAREIVFSCAALQCPNHQHEPLRNVLGSDTFGPWLRDNPSALIPTDLDGELGKYLKQLLGGYGQVYRGAMIDLELICPDDMNPEANFDVVYGKVGAAVAETFASAIAKTRYVREFIDKDDAAVPLGVIQELAEVSCFCQLRNHEPERKLLTDVLLGHAQAAASSHAQNAEVTRKRTRRAETIKMFLDLAQQTQTVALNETNFRELLYYGRIGNELRWHPRSGVQRIWRLWWLIQLREVVVSGLNSLFRDFVRWGSNNGGLYHPLNVDSYLREVGEQPLSTIPGLATMKLTQLTLGQLASKLDQYILHKGWPLSQNLQAEAHSAITEQILQPFTPITALLTFLFAQRRWVSIQEHDTLTQEEQDLLHEGARERLSTYYLFHLLAEHVKRDVPAIQTFTILLKDMVVDQHINIALGKLPMKTFLFYEDDSGIRFDLDNKAETTPISVRFDAISEALYGLDLIQASLNKPTHAPTSHGLEIMNG